MQNMYAAKWLLITFNTSIKEREKRGNPPPSPHVICHLPGSYRKTLFLSVYPFTPIKASFQI